MNSQRSSHTHCQAPQAQAQNQSLPKSVSAPTQREMRSIHEHLYKSN